MFHLLVVVVLYVFLQTFALTESVQGRPKATRSLDLLLAWVIVLGFRTVDLANTLQTLGGRELVGRDDTMTVVTGVHVDLQLVVGWGW